MFLCRKPFLHAASSVEYRAAHTCSWWPDPKRIPTVERALVPSQLGGKFLDCHEFCEDRYQLRHGDVLRAVTCAQIAIQGNRWIEGIITENLKKFYPLKPSG